MPTLYKSELMQSWEPLLPLNGKNKDSLRAVYSGEHSEDSHVFSLGNDDQLYAITHGNPKSGNGWHKCRVSTVSEVGKGVMFDLFQSRVDGKFSFSLVCKTESSFHVYVSPIFENSNVANSFNDEQKDVLFWNRKFFLPEGCKEVTSISHHTNFTLVSVIDAQEKACYYLLNHDDKSIVNYEYPEQVDRIHCLKIGQVYGTVGVFGMVTNGSQKEVVFQGFVDPVYHKTAKYRYTPKGEKDLKCFALVQDADGNSIVFTGGSIIAKFDNPDVESELVHTFNSSPQLIDLFVGNNPKEGTYSIFLLNDEFQLSYMSNTFHASNQVVTKWNSPLVVFSQVGAVSCVVGSTQHITDHVFYTSTSGLLQYCYYGGPDSLWTTGNVLVGDNGNVVERKHYSAEITLEPVQDVLAGAVDLVVSSSSNTYLTIDGFSHIVGPSKTATIPVEAFKNSVTLVYQVDDSISAPVFTLTCSRLTGGSLKIDPSLEFTDKLKGLDAEKLKSANRQNGQKLLNGSFNDETLQGVSNGVNVLLDTSKDLEKNKHSRVTKNVKAAIMAGEAKHICALKFEGNTVTYLPPHQVHEHAKFHAQASWTESLGHAFGVIARFVENLFDKIKSIVLTMIDDLVHIVIEIAGEVLSCIIKSAQQLVHAVTWVFEKISLGVKDLIEWVGFIFSWDDIVTTMDVLSSTFEQVFTNLPSMLDRFQIQFDNKMDEFQKSIDQKLFEKQIDDMKDQTVVSQREKTSNTQVQPDPSGNWISGKMNHAQEVEFTTKGKAPSINPLTTQFPTDFSDLSLVNLITGKETFSHFFKKLMSIVSHTLIAGAKEVGDNCFSAMKTSFASISDYLMGEISVPFFSALFDTVIGKRLNKKFSFLNLVCLIIAVPYTITYKLVEKKQPFIGTDAKKQFEDSVTKLFAGETSVSSNLEVHPNLKLATTSAPNFHIGVGVIRLIRSVTCPAAGLATIAGDSFAAPIQTVDFFLRFIGSVFDLLLGQSNFKWFSSCYFLLALGAHGYGSCQALSGETPYFNIKTGTGKTLNVLATLDAIALFIMAGFQAADLSEHYGELTAQEVGARMGAIIFRMFCIVSVLCIFMKMDSAAVGVIALRALAIMGSGFNEVLI